MVDPVLKWAGGKRQLLDELYARFPAEYGEFHEPMFGGGAVFFDLEPVGGTINDTNPRLANFYREVRDNPREMIEMLESFQGPETEAEPEREFSDVDRKGKEIGSYYYQQRALFNRRPNDEPFDETVEAALLLYLNRTCYNGLYRENRSGGFNVPIGRYSNPDWVRRNEVREASEVLDDVEILNRDFSYILEYADEGDLVYFDPPFEPLSPTANFTDYSAEGFGKEDQERLVEVAEKLDENGVYVILSNSGVTYGMYDDAGFYVETEGATRAINSDEENRGEVDEIVATNVSKEERVATGL
ncbi:MAG: DNA adenine methylase [Halobacteria archaeon]